MQNIPTNNFDRFQRNRKSVRKNIESFLGADLATQQQAEIQTQDIKAFDSSNFSVDGITKVIENIDVMRDQNLGVTRYKAQDKEGNAHIIRDARNVNGKYPKDSGHSNAMLMLATARAALFMIEHSAKAPHNTENAQGHQELELAKERLAKLTNWILEDISRNAATLDQVHEFNKYVLDILKDTPLKDNKHLKKELQNTNHMMNFHNTAQHITTLSTVVDKDNNQHVGIESEVMLLGFTDAQKEMFQRIRNGRYDRMKQMKVEGINFQDYPWYDKLSEYEKAVVKDALKQCMDDKGNMIHPFPTQVREILPGLRNAYYKETATLDDQGIYTQVVELFHSGSLYLKIKTQDAQELVTSMAEQLGTFMSKDGVKKYIDVVLNSPANIFNREESKVAKMVKHAMRTLGNYFSVTPLNFFRLFSGSDFRGYETFLNEFGNAYIKGFETQQLDLRNEFYPLYYIQKGGYSTGARKELAAARKDPRYQHMLDTLDIIEQCINARELMDSYAFIFDADNRNLQLAKIFADLNFAINNENGLIRKHFNDKGQGALLDSIPQINMHCMSGIDRLGLTANRCSNNALNKHYGVEEGSPQYDQNNQNIVNAGHTQAMPSLNNSGAHGVKKDSQWAIPEADFKNVAHITTNAASNNKLKYADVSLDKARLDKKPAIAPIEKKDDRAKLVPHFVADEKNKQAHKEKEEQVKTR